MDGLITARPRRSVEYTEDRHAATLRSRYSLRACESLVATRRGRDILSRDFWIGVIEARAALRREEGHLAPKAYVRQTKPEYGVKAAGTMTASLRPSREAPTEVVFEGPCPECDEVMTYRHPLFIVKDATGAISDSQAAYLWREAQRRAGGADKVIEQITVYCQCDTVHEKDQEGCGAYWKMKASW